MPATWSSVPPAADSSFLLYSQAWLAFEGPWSEGHLPESLSISRITRTANNVLSHKHLCTATSSVKHIFEKPTTPCARSGLVQDARQGLCISLWSTQCGAPCTAVNKAPSATPSNALAGRPGPRGCSVVVRWSAARPSHGVRKKFGSPANGDPPDSISVRAVPQASLFYYFVFRRGACARHRLLSSREMGSTSPLTGLRRADPRGQRKHKSSITYY